MPKQECIDVFTDAGYDIYLNNCIMCTKADEKRDACQVYCTFRMSVITISNMMMIIFPNRVIPVDL